MKLIITVTANIVLSVFGNTQLDTTLKNVYEEVKAKTEKSTGRAIVELTGPFQPYEYIKAYGCWCNFENFRAGRREPVDFIDEQCKALHDNYECINRANVGTGCSAEQDVYNDNAITSFISLAAFQDARGDSVKAAQYVDQFLTRCENLNAGNNCLIDACKAESYFIYKIVFKIFEVTEDNSNRHINGFDTSISCAPTQTGVVDRIMMCCGESPFNKFFNANSPAHLLSPDTCKDAKGDVLPF